MALMRQRRVSLTVAGVDYGVWDTSTGAEVDSPEKLYRPGAMYPPVSKGGAPQFSPLILTAYFDPTRDQAPMDQLGGLAGRGFPAAFSEVTELFLDVDGNMVGEGKTHTGTLKRVKWPDSDSESDDEAMREVEITITDIEAT